MSCLRISEPHLRQIGEHAAATYPEECCGVLIGRVLEEEPETRLVEELIVAENQRQDSRHNRYVINPRDLLEAHKKARSQGLDIVGYYHSHPEHPARPSEFDREHAWPETSYLIVSVEKGEVVDARSWRLTEDRGGFDEELLQGVDGSGAPQTGKEAPG